MNRERAKELLPIIEAFADGKDIEWRMEDEGWDSHGDPYWGNLFEYRIKPKPREFWIDLSSLPNIPSRVHIERQPAGSNAAGTTRIKVREIIE